MRPLILLTILLASAICSCRTQKHEAVQLEESTEIVTSQQTTTSAADSLWAAITSSTDLVISDFVITFFPPDSAYPDARAAPASVAIGSINARATSDTRLQRKSESTASGNAGVNIHSQTAVATTSDSGVNSFPPAKVIVAIILSGLLIAATLYYFRVRK